MEQRIIVIGAGPSGLNFARSLADTSINIILIERQPKENLANPQWDGREIALTHFSIKLMKENGTWERLPKENISPIKKAKVVDGTSNYSLTFNHKEARKEALGYLVPNHLIRKASYEEVLSLPNVEIIDNVSVDELSTDLEKGTVVLSNGEVLTANLIVSADSRFSETRRKMGISAKMKDFGRTVIVSKVTHEHSNENTAFECFHYGRTMAVLPLNTHESSIVITISSEKAQEIMNMSDESFNADIEKQLNSKFGKMTVQTTRVMYPLVGVHADRFYGVRYALIGDAAVGMHPVTAHGFNLGMRGQNTLANEIKQAYRQGRDIGSLIVLQAYNRKHQLFTRPLYYGTNTIVTAFTNETAPGKLLRKALLRVSNNIPPLKRQIMNQLTEL